MSLSFIITFLIKSFIRNLFNNQNINEFSYKKPNKMNSMATNTELDLGIQRIKKMGSYHYIGIPKQLVDARAIPIDADYHVKVIVEKHEITITRKAEVAP